jgi:ubiquinone/menaquinone biosynthesis C-methylase UbiE
MDRLENAAELLDGPLDDLAALAGNLRDFRRINRWLGGVALSRAAVLALASDRTDLSLLDVGTGGADIPAALVADARRRGRRVRVVAADSRHEVLAAARMADPGLAAHDGIELHVADGRGLPYADRSFDLAHASLVLHHLEPPEGIALLREMARVSRRGVVINDLDRSRAAWFGAWLLGHFLTANRFTRHDAPLSVRRAYTLPEARELHEAAGLRVVWSRRGGPFEHRYALAAVAIPTREIEGVGEDGR